MLRKHSFWKSLNTTKHKNNKKNSRRTRRSKSFRSTMLGVEWLEDRVVLSANPILSVVGPQTVDEGAPLNLTDIGIFTDVVESSAPAIGLNPADYSSLGVFDPGADVTINTDTLQISGGFSGVGTTEWADTGAGPYQIAVFTFTSFELDLGRKITGSGSKPFALLSKGNMTIAGQIDVSAESDGDIFNGERIAGPGGGNGGLGHGGLTPAPEDGYPAAGAPADSIGTWEITTASTKGGGTGAGFGGDGGQAYRSIGILAGTVGDDYGDLSLGVQGGSGGATAGNANLSGTGALNGGGGGGGGVELGAVGTLIVTGQVLADGGNGLGNPADLSQVGGGGGGAGGGILIHAATVDIGGPLNSVSAKLSANGGAGGPAPSEGGGGGGGRILVAGVTVDTGGATITVLGGLNGPEVGGDGENGSFEIEFLSPPSPIIETFNYVINWGDSPMNDSGPVTPLDVPGVNIGDIVAGSFNGGHTYADDGVYTVTVTVTDNNGGTDTETFTVTVGNVAPMLTISGALSVTEGSVYTLNLASFDPGADNLTSLTINWGDGTQTVPGNTTSVTHTYATGGITQAVSATAIDGDGGPYTSNTLNVSVIDVTPSQGTFLNGSVLNVIGATAGTNTAIISVSNGNISVNGSFNGTNPVTFPLSSITEIVVQLGNSTDILITAGNVNVPMIIDAGGGNDLITTGSGNDVIRGGGGVDIIYAEAGDDVILGGIGNDDLFGGAGNDVLIGGDGTDMLFGGSGRDFLIGSEDQDLLNSGDGDDILIGGVTAYDDYDGDNDDAIDAVMAIWTEDTSIDSRRIELTQIGGLLEANVIVTDDNDTDMILGGAGRDLLFGDNSSIGDGVQDLLSWSSVQDRLVQIT